MILFNVCEYFADILTILFTLLLNLQANLSKFYRNHFNMQQKKSLPNKREANIKGYILLIISALIIIPVTYLLIRNAFIPDKSNKIELLAGIDTITTGPIVQQVTLQDAINLAATQPNENNYINLGLQYYNQAMYKECIDATKKALDCNAQSYLAYNNLCSAYNQLGMWDEAIAAGEKALKIKPGDQLAGNNLKVSQDGKMRQKK
jgi:tetratricopeptide (TPR) repeat protein